MNADFHDEKDRKNKERHGLSLADADELDWKTAITRIDRRRDYGEIRFVTYAFYRNRLHCLVWTERHEQQRYISFRKANVQEQRIYDKEIKKRTLH